MTDEPSTRKASHPLAASIAASALSLGTLSPKKTTFKEMEKIKVYHSYWSVTSKDMHVHGKKLQLNSIDVDTY